MAAFQIRGTRVTAVVRRKGYPRQSKTFGNKTDAKLWAQKIEAQMALGEFTPTPAGAEMTVHAAIEHFIYKGQQEAQRGSKRRIYHLDSLKELRLRQIQKQGFSQFSLHRLPAIEIIEWRDEMLESLAPATVTKRLGDLSKLFRIARKEWQILGLLNPVEDVIRPGGSASRNRRLMDGEEVRLMKAAKGCPRLRLLPEIIQFALETGMRRGEIASFTRAQITGRVLQLEKTKNGDRRAVPLSAKAISLIPNVIGKPVFGCSPHSITTAFREACRMAKIEDLRFHDLRHEAISRFFERGFDIMAVADMVGHKTLNQLRNYTHHKAERLADQLDRQSATPE